MTSGGWIVMTPTFRATELDRRDMRGGCSPAMLPHALTTATGYLVWWGMNFGFQPAGSGITGYAGLLYASAPGSGERDSIECAPPYLLK
jgi:hypothetical protein